MSRTCLESGGSHLFAAAFCLLAAGVLTACSLNDFGRTPCSDNAECVSAFEGSFVCNDGFCMETSQVPCTTNTECRELVGDGLPEGSASICTNDNCVEIQVSQISCTENGDADCRTLGPGFVCGDPDTVGEQRCAAAIPFQLARDCGVGAQTVSDDSSPPGPRPSVDDFTTTTAGLGNSSNQVLACLGRSAPGDDGFFAVDIEQGQKWHFHLRTAGDPDADPAIYIFQAQGDTCDTRECPAGFGLDACGRGVDEHLSFVAPNTATYFVAIDSSVAGEAEYNLEIYQPDCGADGTEHSEACDGDEPPQGATAGSVCGDDCRWALPAGASSEIERPGANDDPFAANVLTLDAEPAVVSGNVRAGCELDYYLFNVSESVSLVASLTDNGGECRTPTLEFNLLDGNSLSVLQNDSTTGGQCPRIERNLDAGPYYLQLTSQGLSAEFPYVLNVAVTPTE